MSWSYRIVRTVIDGETDYAIHEHYTGKHHGPKGQVTARSIAASGETVDDVRIALERMLQACDLDVLDMTDFEGGKE